MILYGKPVAENVYEKLKTKIVELKSKQINPSLAVILVGDDLASLNYVKAKEKIVNTLGIDFKLYHLPQETPQEEIEKLIDDLNMNKFVHGILVQLPLPQNLETDKIINKIIPQKDVDGFLGNFPAATAAAILETLNFYRIELKGKKVVLVGHGRLVGKPLEKLLLAQGITPVICDINTKDLPTETLAGDILVSGVGKPGLIQKEMVREDVVLIDAGTAECNGKMIGDVDPVVYEKVKTYTPTPGGIGPVTVSMLMRNLVEAASEQS